METEIRSINDMDLNTPRLINDDTMSENDPYQNQNQRQRQQEEFIYYNQQPPPHQQVNYQDKKDLFTNLDKTAYVVIFVAFILGFFMGKTMQPVILRPG